MCARGCGIQVCFCAVCRGEVEPGDEGQIDAGKLRDLSRRHRRGGLKRFPEIVAGTRGENLPPELASRDEGR